MFISDFGFIQNVDLDPLTSRVNLVWSKQLPLALPLTGNHSPVKPAP